MRRVGSVVLAWVLALAAGECLKAQEATVTLTQCYGWARAHYPQIRQYGLIDRTEQYNLANASKGWLPQLEVQARATYQSDVTKLPFDAEKLSAVLPGIQIPTLGKDQYQVVAQVNQPIWDGGLIRATRQITQAEARASREQLESELYALKERVNQLYFGCLLQDQLIGQHALLQEELQVNLDRVEALVANGLANASDRERMEVELLHARQREIELRAARTTYRLLLGTLVGRPLAADERMETPPITDLPFSEAMGRPELSALEAQRSLIASYDKQLTAGIMPRVGLFVQGGYGRPGLNMLENDFGAFYLAGVRLNWNLGRLYTLKNDRRKMDVNRLRVDVQRDIFLFNTSLERLRLQTEIRKMADLMQADDAIIRLRTRIREAAEAQLANGVISVSDLIRELHAESAARQTAALHRLELLQSHYQLRYTTNE